MAVSKAPLGIRRWLRLPEVSELVADSETVAGISASTVALSKDVELSTVSANGASDNTLSLADGVPGQRKVVVLTAKASTGNGVVQPDNLHGGTTVTLSAVGQAVEFVFVGGSWTMIGGSGSLA